MAKFRPQNPKRTINKVRPGSIQTNKIKSVEYMPSVFQTDINKQWMDSTFDQMISKADLEDIDAFVGSKEGRFKKVNDAYLYESAHVLGREKKQLEPGLVTKDKSGNVVSKISVDDIANAVNINFDEYNYNAAYSTEAFTFSPPINIDMFTNYHSYYWINNLPVYESTNNGKRVIAGDGQTIRFYFNDYRTITAVYLEGVPQISGVDFQFLDSNTIVEFYSSPATGDRVDIRGAPASYTVGPLTDINRQPLYTITDDNGVFDLQEGMLIRWKSGYTDTYDGFHSDKVYIVTGVGDRIYLREYLDENGKLKWADLTQYTDLMGAFWDNNKILTLSKTGPLAEIESIIAGEKYEISIIGDTDWALLGASTPVAVGDQFVAATTPGLAGQTGTTGFVRLIDARGASPRAIQNTYNSTPVSSRGSGLSFNISELSKTAYIEDGMIVMFGDDWQYDRSAKTIKKDVQYKIINLGTMLPSDWSAVGATGTLGEIFTATADGLSTYDGAVNIDTEKYKIFYVSIDKITGNIYFNRIVNAQWDSSGNIEQFIPVGLTLDQQVALASIKGTFDVGSWDSLYTPNSVKDYIVQNRSDRHGTAWARCNLWIHRDLVSTLKELMPSLNFDNYINTKNQAKRPIIEFEPNLELMNHGNSYTWHGLIDFVVADFNETDILHEGTTFVLETSASIFRKFNATSIQVGKKYRIRSVGTTDYTTIGAADNNIGTVFTAIGTPTGNGVVFEIVTKMVEGDTLVPMGSPALTETVPFESTPIEKYKFRDCVFNGTSIQIAQIKGRQNHPPLFKLQDDSWNKLDDESVYPESNFKGNKIISYKTTDLQETIDYELGVYGYVTLINRDKLNTDYHLYDDTSSVDSELGFPLVFKDVGKGADYVFENNLFTRKYNYTVLTHDAKTIGKKRTIPGYFNILQNNRTKSNYLSTVIPAGAYETLTKEISSISEDLTINVGYDDWRPRPSSSTYRNEFLVYLNGQNSLYIASITSKGVYNIRTESESWFVLEKSAVYKFHDLVGDASNPFKFYLSDRTTEYTTGVTRTDEDGDGYFETVILTAPADKNIALYYGYDSLPDVTSRLGRLITVDSKDYLWHTLRINGTFVKSSDYTINADSIVVSKDLLKVGDIVDLKYYPNESLVSTNTNVPTVHTHNPLNKPVETFTISETISHWQSIIEHTPGFDGQSFGLNNTHKCIHNKMAGGEIFMYNDISVMHDLNYADHSINIASSLHDQARDWNVFKNRFVSQVIRLYQTNTYPTVRQLVDDVLDQIVDTKRGTDLHRYSNMLYAPNNQYDIIEYTKITADILNIGSKYRIIKVNATDFTALGAADNNIGTIFTATASDSTTAAIDLGIVIEEQNFSSKFTINSDLYQRDHMYVYLTQNDNGTMVEKMLSKDVEYTLNGSIIEMPGIPQPGPAGEVPYISVYYHDMDSESYIPASMTKLGLNYRSTPTIYTNVILGHDGTTYDIDSTKDFYNTSASNFDVVNACIFELEKRCYNGLVENIDNCSWEKFIPSQHRETWYTYADINNYIEKYFAEWWRDQGKPSLTPENYYDPSDSRTWNYNSIDFSGKTHAGLEHLEGNVLPGYWRGAYITLFGTSTPHLTPWNMLGIDRKPTWWDTNYPSPDVSGSWADITKRTALDNAVKKGIINDPAENPKQDIRFARYYWDWLTSHPVTLTGSLEDRAVVLGTPLPSDAATPFVFGDWGPVEYDWRISSLGVASMVDAMLKFNPTKAMSEFFQPGYLVQTDDHHQIWNVTKNTKKLLTPKDLYYHGKTYGKILKKIEIRDGSDGWGKDTTVNILNGDSVIIATATVDVDSTGTIKHVSLTGRGLEYVDSPVLDFDNKGSGANIDAYINANPVLTQKPFYSNGLCQVQFNAIIRNKKSTDLEQQYYSLDTQLIQKMGGFTDKNLLSFYTESGPNGAFRISEIDYENYMYEGNPTELNVASVVKIIKNTTSYSIDGVSTGKQQFRFFEPDKSSGAFTNVNVLDRATIKKYNRFVKSSASVIEFNAELSKVQDVYDFIRGYYEYLGSLGYSFPENHTGDNQALEFAEWAVEADTDETYIVFLPDTIYYAANHGHISEFGTLPGNVNVILASDGTAIPNEYLKINRGENSISVGLNDNPLNIDVLGCVAIAEIDYEHAIIFSNITQFNETIHNSLFNQRQWRLKLTGKRTKDWDGRKTAPGYLIEDNKIIENFDTSVRKIDDYYSYNIENLNPGITKAENLTIGNVDREWISDLRLNDNTIGKFYQGVITDKGTNSVIDRIGRSNLVNYGLSNVKANEEWMFRHSYFGDTTKTKSTEILVTPSRNYEFSPAIIDLDELSTEDFVNDQRTSTSQAFDVVSFEEYNKTYRFYGASPLLTNESHYKLLTADELSTLYSETANYAIIPTWNGQTSYKKDDKVRYNGKLYKCSADFIGYSNVPTDLEFTGTVTHPVASSPYDFASLSNGDSPSATIDGVDIYFDKQETVYDSISALSISGATVASPSDITIDGFTISLVYRPLTTIIDTSAIYNGNPYVTTRSLGTPAIANNTGMQLIINGSVIDLYDPTTNPPGSSITISDIVNYINNSDPSGLLTASPDTTDPTRITIVYNVQGNPTTNLVIGSGSANTDLGLSAASYPPATTTSNVDGNMTPTIIAQLIRDTGILGASYRVDVTASDELRITRFPTATPTATMIITGSAVSALGIPTSTSQTSSIVDANSSVEDVRNFINAAGITGVTASVVSNSLRITSTNSSIDLGLITNEMNTTAGIPGGVHTSTITVVDNDDPVTESANWTDISTEDPALFSIELANDSGTDDDNSQTDSGLIDGDGNPIKIQSKFFDWNVLQVQRGYLQPKPVKAAGITYTSIDLPDYGWYTEDPDTGTTTDCGICAGNATADGNDACINLPTGFSHNLEVGDYVLILNSTTTPSVDGIHKVTSLGAQGEDYKFYIDMYIEECGNSPAIFPLRNARFASKTDMDNSIASDRYLWNNLDRVYLTTLNNDPGTYVYSYNKDLNNWVYERSTTVRPTNTTIENVIIYDGQTQETIVELELYDPIRGIIPGVADREIDERSSTDLAVYTDSTETTFVGNDRLAWGENEVGRTWWDLSTVLYYDYDQGNTNYHASNWGNLYPGADIDIYEWTKSSVPPEEWNAAVESEQDMYGQIATGEAYSVYDPVTEENNYYYSELTIWNSTLVKDEIVYYFWVKNKNTVPNINRNLTVKQIASIIKDPTNNGISWCAAMGANELLIKNISYYLSQSTVLQINKKPKSASHNSWQIIRENDDAIGDYWYHGLKDNIVGIQERTGIYFPNSQLHPYNRYGDDRARGQGWYEDTFDARREAISIANSMLINMNLLENLDGIWDRTIGYDNHVIDVGVNVTDTVYDWSKSTSYVLGDEVKWNRYVWKCVQAHTSSTDAKTDFGSSTGYWVITAKIYDLTKMWDWADYVAVDRLIYQKPSLSVNNASDLETVDTDNHQLVMVKIYDDVYKLDRSEILKWNGTEWILVEKKNGTIQFNDLIWNKDQINLWDEDGDAWDSTAWDSDTVVWADYFVYALRHDLFIQQFENNFNKFFFGMVKYAHSLHNQLDWAYKTTYIQVNIETPMSSVPRKYVKNNVNTLLGYINTVKPFHTKVRNVFDSYTAKEDVKIDIDETINKHITVQFAPYDMEELSEFPLVYGGDTLVGSESGNVEYTGADFTDASTYDNLEGGDFLQPNNYNWINKTTWAGYPAWSVRPYDANTNRALLVGITPQEHLSIMCTTNPSGSVVTPDSRTFTYMQDNWLNVKAYALTQNSATETQSGIDWVTGLSYNVGDIVSYQDALYKCNTAHTSSIFSDDIVNWDSTDEFPIVDETVFNTTGGYAWYNGEIIKYAGIDTGKLIGVQRRQFNTFGKGYIAGYVVDITNKDLTTFSRMSYKDNAVGYRYSVDGPSIIDASATDQEAVELQSSSQGIDF